MTNNFEASKHPRNRDAGRPGNPAQFAAVANPEDTSVKLDATQQAVQHMYDQGTVLADAKATAAQAATAAIVAVREKCGIPELVFRYYDGGDGPRLVFVGTRDAWGEFSPASDDLHHEMSAAASLITDYSWLVNETTFFTEDDEHFTVSGDALDGKIRKLAHEAGRPALGIYLKWIRGANRNTEAGIRALRDRDVDALTEDIVDASLDAILYSTQDMDEEVTVDPAREDEILAHFERVVGNTKRWSAPLLPLLEEAYKRGEVDDETWLRIDESHLTYYSGIIQQAGEKLIQELS